MGAARGVVVLALVALGLAAWGCEGPEVVELASERVIWIYGGPTDGVPQGEVSWQEMHSEQMPPVAHAGKAVGEGPARGEVGFRVSGLGITLTAEETVRAVLRFHCYVQGDMPDYVELFVCDEAAFSAAYQAEEEVSPPVEIPATGKWVTIELPLTSIPVASYEKSKVDINFFQCWAQTRNCKLYLDDIALVIK